MNQSIDYLDNPLLFTYVPLHNPTWIGEVKKAPRASLNGCKMPQGVICDTVQFGSGEEAPPKSANRVS